METWSVLKCLGLAMSGIWATEYYIKFLDFNNISGYGSVNKLCFTNHLTDIWLRLLNECFPEMKSGTFQTTRLREKIILCKKNPLLQTQFYIAEVHFISTDSIFAFENLLIQRCGSLLCSQWSLQDLLKWTDGRQRPTVPTQSNFPKCYVPPAL